MSEPGLEASALVTEASAAELIGRLEANVSRVLRGKPEAIRLAVVCLLARGHMLIEDVPGVGKTTLAQALARSVGLEFQRIQFTSDLLPSDILGVSVYRQVEERFEFAAGPIFANVVLADEINRASPKTQSALLESMSERQVTVDGVRRELPDPFVVLATQNPFEYVGTFPLPESQLDRFLMSLELGYPPANDELQLLRSAGAQEALQTLDPVLTRDELLELQLRVAEVRIADQLAEYLLALVRQTRESDEFLLGVSTRGAQGLFRAVQAWALAEGRAFAIPDDVQAVVPSVLAHRILLRGGQTKLAAARRAIGGIVDGVPVPL